MRFIKELIKDWRSLVYVIWFCIGLNLWIDVMFMKDWPWYYELPCTLPLVWWTARLYDKLYKNK